MSHFDNYLSQQQPRIGPLPHFHGLNIKEGGTSPINMSDSEA